MCLHGTINAVGHGEEDWLQEGHRNLLGDRNVSELVVMILTYSLTLHEKCQDFIR